MMANKFIEIANTENYDLETRLDKKSQASPVFNGKRVSTLSVSISKKNSEYLDKLVKETNAKSRTSVLETLIDVYYDKLFNQ